MKVSDHLRQTQLCYFAIAFFSLKSKGGINQKLIREYLEFGLFDNQLHNKTFKALVGDQREFMKSLDLFCPLPICPLILFESISSSLQWGF